MRRGQLCFGQCTDLLGKTILSGFLREERRHFWIWSAGEEL